MRYHTQDHGYTSILFLKDDLTFHDIQELGTILYNAVRAANGALIVDMSGVGAMDITITGQFVALIGRPAASGVNSSWRMSSRRF
ncbi:MAG: hypothetical protein IPI28_15155 [Candidatus Omnitrophica bacterium]|nr:hypothetical protein [Candidatus Omnitrophota bacterium]